MSDLDDFTVYKSDAVILVALETLAPIRGTGSLRIYPNSPASRYVNMVRATGNKAFTSGRVRFLCRVDGFLAGAFMGFAFQQSQADLTTSGTAYLFQWLISNTSNFQQLQIHRCTAGLPTSTQLFASPNFPWNTNVTMALECTWIVDLVNLGGIRFNVKRGSAEDFSDLADVAGLTNVLTTTNLLTTSVGEGPAWWGGTTNQHNYLYDSMSCVPLLVT
jgi:hypothetical protein